MIFVLICRDTEGRTLCIMTFFIIFIYPLSPGGVVLLSDHHKISFALQAVIWLEGLGDAEP